MSLSPHFTRPTDSPNPYTPDTPRGVTIAL